MSKTPLAIEIEHLSKVYNISHQNQAPYATFREAMGRAARKPLRLITGQRLQREKFWALDDVNFTVEQGDIIGIIGRNGSGKSTLLKILSRIVEPTSGQALMHGTIASLLEVGTGFHPELTGRENIYFNGAILGMPRKEINRKFDDIVAFSEVEKFLDTPVKFYSSGMYVRLAFAIAAQLEPDILIVDEVLAVGDASFQRKSLGRMSDISKTGRTVLFVSHSMGSIRDLCTKGVVMDNGKATFYNDINDAITAYNTQSAPTPGETVLAAAKDKAIVFTNFTVNQQPAEQEPTIFSGDPLRIDLRYKSRQTGQELYVGYGVRSRKTGDLVVFTHSGLEDVRHETGKTGGLTTTLEVPRLAPGSYTLEFTAWLDKVHIIDSQELCAITIQPTPAFASNTTLANFPSTLLIDSRWEYHK